jgi:hypothetical protein
MQNIEDFDSINLVCIEENKEFGIKKYAFSRETASLSYFWINDLNEFHHPAQPAFRRMRLDNSNTLNHDKNEYAEWYEKYYNCGVLHRRGGPAVIYSNGCEEWYENGILHREDGPAQYGPYVINASFNSLARKYDNDKRTERWFKNGLYHREGGPAITIYAILSPGRTMPVIVQTIYYKNDKITNTSEPAITIYEYKIIGNSVETKKKEQYWIDNCWISKKLFDEYQITKDFTAIHAADRRRRLAEATKNMALYDSYVDKTIFAG